MSGGLGGLGSFVGDVVSHVFSPEFYVDQWARIGNATGLKPKKPNINIPGQPVMPVLDDKAMQDARRRMLAQQMARGGRASTILTSDRESLG